MSEVKEMYKRYKNALEAQQSGRERRATVISFAAGFMR